MDLNQWPYSVASDQGLHCLHRSTSNYGKYGTNQSITLEVFVNS